MHLSELAGRRVAVWGTGREGVAAIEAIAPVGPASLVAVQDKTTFLASRWDGPLADLAPLYEGEAMGPALEGVEVLVRSPGVGESNPWIQRLRRRGVTITGGTALWMADHAKQTIGVTGSKGKSTTTTLISHLLSATGRPNVLGGNIGIAVLSLPPAERYVLELSMYQCADLLDSPHIAVVTSLFEEHLDWTRDGLPSQYYAHKLNIAAHGPEAVVYNDADPTLSAELAARPGLPLVPAAFSVAGDGWVVGSGERLFPRDAFPLRGRHNAGNLCVALTALQAAGVDVAAERAALEEGLRSYTPLPHRLTPIADPSGVEFVNDSLSTAPQTTIHAIEAYAGRPLAVIVGGQDRGIDYTPLRDFLRDIALSLTLVAVPDSGEHILDVVGDLPGITRVVADDLPDAVRRCRTLVPSGGVVLLSPAAPSYGRYDNYEARAKAFIEAIEATRPAVG